MALSVLEGITEWIKECIEEYKHVRPQPNWTPTRLLKITDLGHEVRLHTPDMGNTNYAALSHCWGTIPSTALASHDLRDSKLQSEQKNFLWLFKMLSGQRTSYKFYSFRSIAFASSKMTLTAG